MAENRFPCGSASNSRETICIDTNRVLDSCRDRDCFERVRVYLSCFGNEVLEHTGAIRAKSAKIVWSYIGIDPIQFNSGFYALTIRFYVKLTFEACIGGGRSQDLEGIAVLEKRVVLFGGESNVNIFKSSPCDSFCALPQPVACQYNLPTAYVEVVNPVILDTKIVEKASECNCSCCCCCQENDLPEAVLSSMNEPLLFDDDHGHNQRFLTVSLGIFSVVRLVRPAQLLVSATEYCIPEKECASVEDDNPCRVFKSMPFPINEFCTQGLSHGIGGSEHAARCGCGS